MGRSTKKGPFVARSCLARWTKQTGRPTRTRSRPGLGTARSCPNSSGYTFMVHNGKMFHKVFVTEDMVGHKLGEFSATRTFRGHSSKKIK